MKKYSFIPKIFRPAVPGSLRKIKKNVRAFIPATVEHQNKKKCPILISARDDIVSEWFYKLIDHSEHIKHLYYDDLGIKWDFSYSNNKIKIYLKNSSVVEPSSIYHRHPGFLKNHPFRAKHLAFFEVLDIWQGVILGQKRDHYHNSSKAYQCITTISQAISLVKDSSIKYPKSFFIKGSDIDFQSILIQKQLIVKSNSSIRSEVVDSTIFSLWDHKNLENVPTLFQEKIDGIDHRVHVCPNFLWALQVLDKNTVDYRYSRSCVQYNQIELPKNIHLFCQKLAKIELNELIGIDLIAMNGVYFCLESNPGPGWSTFRHPSRIVFSRNLLTFLQQGDA